MSVQPSKPLAAMMRDHQNNPRREQIYPAPIHLVIGVRLTLHNFLARLAPRLLTPRALCGVSMWGEPSQGPLPYPQSPLCPNCVTVDGRDAETIIAHTRAVPGRWI